MVGGPQCRLSGPICGDDPASQKPPVTEGCGSDVNPEQTVSTAPRVDWELQTVAFHSARSKLSTSESRRLGTDGGPSASTRLRRVLRAAHGPETVGPGRLLRSGHPSQNPTQFRFSIDRQPTRARICVAFLLGLPNMGVRRLLTTPAIALL